MSAFHGSTRIARSPAAVSYTHLSDFVNGLILYVDGGILAYIGKQPQ